MMYIDYLNKHKDQLCGMTPKEVLQEVKWTQEDYNNLNKSDYPSWKEQGSNKLKYLNGISREEARPKKQISLSEMMTERTRRVGIRSSVIFGTKI